MSEILSLDAWLMDRGLTAQEAELWGDFIADAIDLIDDGHALLRDAMEWKSFLGGCKGTNPTEPEITSGLGDRAKRLRNEAPVDSDRDRLQVSYEVPTPGDELHGTRKSKADFRFERKFVAGFVAAFVIEAKPLRDRADISKRYLGDDGLGCFLKRKPPYSKELAVGMLGYAYSDFSTWISAIAELVTDGTTTIRSGSMRLARGKPAFASDHPRADLGLEPVTVLHAVLDFSQSVTR